MGTKIVSALMVLLLSPLAAAQEVDLPTLLVGKWEGDVQFKGGSKSGDQGRTLVITSVVQKGGVWTWQGTYGITGRGSGRVLEPGIAVDGKNVTIRFMTGEKNLVTLDLIDGKYLRGTQRFSLGERDLRLDKVK